MPIIERADLSDKRRNIPASVKLLLLAAVVVGLYLRTCWYDTKDRYYDITNIELAGQTLSSVDVYFIVRNYTNMERQESVLIRVFTDTDVELASRITTIDVLPRSERRYRKMVEGWSRALREGESLSHATVELFKPSIF